MNNKLIATWSSLRISSFTRAERYYRSFRSREIKNCKNIMKNSLRRHHRCSSLPISRSLAIILSSSLTESRLPKSAAGIEFLEHSMLIHYHQTRIRKQLAYKIKYSASRRFPAYYSLSHKAIKKWTSCICFDHIGWGILIVQACFHHSHYCSKNPVRSLSTSRKTSMYPYIKP